MIDRLTQPNVVLPAAVVAAAPVLGLLAGYNPLFALAAALGGAFVAFVLNDLFGGMCIMAFLASLDGVPALGGGAISAPKLAGLLLAVSWIATVTSRREETILDRRPLFVFLLVVFFGWQATSMAWAEDRGSVITSLTRYGPDLLLVAIAWSALRTERQLRIAVLATLAGVLVSAVLSVLGQGADTDDRAAGLAGGANELAAAMVVGIVLCLVLSIMRSNRGLMRPVLVAGIGLCTLALFLSLSRGGLVALGAALAFGVLVAGRWRVPVTVAAGLVVLAAFFYFGSIASLPAREHVLEVGGGTGRTDLWTVGARMIEAEPLRGIGAGNFPIASIHYLLRPGAITSDEFIITVPKVAHNSFIEVAAETGIPGLALFLLVLAVPMWWMYRGARSFEAAGDRDMELLCRGLLVATVGYLVASFFITANYQKLLWVLIAFGPVCQVVGARARQRAEDAAAEEAQAGGEASARPVARRPAHALPAASRRSPAARLT